MTLGRGVATMCRYNAECDDICECLHKTGNGATTDCCSQLIPDANIGVAPPQPFRYAAICEECGVLCTTEGKPSFVKTEVRLHEDSHSANWGAIR